MSDLTFESAGPAGVHYARCEECQCGSHYPKPTWHSWAGYDDIDHADATGQADPSGQRCACPCVDTPGFCAEHAYPEPEIIEVVSLNSEPCGECGEVGACGYDAEGRPMIHTTSDGSEES